MEIFFCLSNSTGVRLHRDKSSYIWARQDSLLWNHSFLHFWFCILFDKKLHRFLVISVDNSSNRSHNWNRTFPLYLKFKTQDSLVQTLLTSMDFSESKSIEYKSSGRNFRLWTLGLEISGTLKNFKLLSKI